MRHQARLHSKSNEPIGDAHVLGNVARVQDVGARAGNADLQATSRPQTSSSNEREWHGISTRQRKKPAAPTGNKARETTADLQHVLVIEHCVQAHALER